MRMAVAKTMTPERIAEAQRRTREVTSAYAYSATACAAAGAWDRLVVGHRRGD
jgi:hypothetical protein